jgi:hypothetical protein
LATIAGEAAMEMLEGYANDMRESVINELLKVWETFDRDTYAMHVLSPALRNTFDLRLECLSSLDGIQYFTHLTKLNLSGCSQLNDLSRLTNLDSLQELKLSKDVDKLNVSPSIIEKVNVEYY